MASAGPFGWPGPVGVPDVPGVEAYRLAEGGAMWRSLADATHEATGPASAWAVLDAS